MNSPLRSSPTPPYDRTLGAGPHPSPVPLPSAGVPPDPPEPAEPFPVSQSLLATISYDVGTLTDCRLWHAGLTETHLVTTDRGRFALRVYRTGWRTDGDVAHELHAIRHLAARGVAVAAPIARRDGAWFAVIRAP